MSDIDDEDATLAALAREYTAAYDAAREANATWRGSLSHTDWDKVREKEGALRDAARKVRGVARHKDSTELRVRAENDRLREEVVKLKREVTMMREGSERRNRDLDALHLVWCNGGCQSGVHRYCGSPDDVTEEVVALAESHVKRLRTWFVNRVFKKMT